MSKYIPLSLWSWNKLKGEEVCVHSDMYLQSCAHESRIMISNTPPHDADEMTVNVCMKNRRALVYVCVIR